MQKTPMLILGGIVAIVLFVWLLDSNQSEYVAEDTPTPVAVTETIVEDDTPETEPIETTESDREEETEAPVPTPVEEVVVETPAPVEPTPVVAAVGTFATHSAAAEAAARNAGDRVVLFFKASWCPSCRGLEADINANLGDIPGDVTIFTVDFDSATDLKVKYGITNRHTMVYIDANGNQIKKWSGSPRLANLLAEI